MNIILIVLLIEVGLRFLPLLDSLAELINHIIAIGVQACNAKIQEIARKSEAFTEEKQSLPIIGFTAPEEKEDDLNYED